MQESDLPGLTASVLWAAFALAVVFGAIAQRTHFCTMGAVADIVNIGDWTRMRMWVLAIGVAMIGFNAMVGGGLDRGRPTASTPAPRLLWLSNLVGGLHVRLSAWCWPRAAAARRWCASAAAT